MTKCDKNPVLSVHVKQPMGGSWLVGSSVGATWVLSVYWKKKYILPLKICEFATPLCVGIMEHLYTGHDDLYPTTATIYSPNKCQVFRRPYRSVQYTLTLSDSTPMAAVATASVSWPTKTTAPALMLESCMT